MEELDEIQTVHNEQIYKFVPMIAHKDIDTGAESVGSGVRIRYGYHHIIATAKHCMIDMPRIMSDKYVYHKDRNELESLRPVPIIDRWMHPSLDIGFLVTSEASGAEMVGDDMRFTAKFEGDVFVYGYPRDRITLDDNFREFTATLSSFGSKPRKQNDTQILLDYPEFGFEWRNGKYVQVPFIRTPKGFSGGPCIGISFYDHNGIKSTKYDLLGLQCCWYPDRRWAEVVPIVHLMREVMRRFDKT